VRVLFFAQAVTLAHLVRPLALIEHLPTGWEVHLACPDNRYRHFLAAFPHPVHKIDAPSPAQFRRLVDWGRQIFTEERLSRDIKTDLDLIERLQPDVVVGDFRLSLSISARVAGVRYVNVCNAYWRADFRPIPPMPVLKPLRWMPHSWLGPLFKRVIRGVFARHAHPFNRLQRRYGLGEPQPDVRYFYTNGEAVLYGDLPEPFSRLDIAENHRFLGPVLWSPPVPPPFWWGDLPRGKPVVYVVAGSSGDRRVFGRILARLARLPVTVIAAIGGQRTGVNGNCHYAPWLDGLQACRRADLMIGNGGVMGCHQALVAGIPVVGVCSNMDQFLNMHAVEAGGWGWGLSANALGGIDWMNFLAARPAALPLPRERCSLNVTELVAALSP